MKRTTLILLAVLGLGLAAAPALAAANKEDFKVIQKAIKKAAPSKADGEVQWLKILIQDSRPGGAEVKLILPVALIKAVLAGTEGRHFKVDDDHCQIDLRAVWKALKNAGPLALVEIEGDGAVLKVWLE